MNKKSFSFAIFMICGLFACEPVGQFNQPRTEQRTRIIAGQPAFDHDYQIVNDQQKKQK